MDREARGAAVSQPADLWWRSAAFIIDTVTIGASVIVLRTSMALDFDPGFVAGISLFVYRALLESAWGTTLGKLAIALRTRSIGGGHPRLWSAVVRNAWLLAWAPLPGTIGDAVGFVFVASIMVSIRLNANSQGWHDQLARTEVVGVGT